MYDVIFYLHVAVHRPFDNDVPTILTRAEVYKMDDV